MTADGQIVLGLDVASTTAQINSDLSSVINNLNTKQVVLKTTIEKSQTKKSVDALVKEINSETAKIGVQVDFKDVSKVLAQQQKITSAQEQIKKKIESAKTALHNFQVEFANIGNSKSATKVTDAIQKLNSELNKADGSLNAVELKNQWEIIQTAVNNAKRAISEFNAERKNFGDLTGISTDLTKMLDYKGLDIDDAAVAKIKTQIQDTITQTSTLIQRLNQLDSSDNEALKDLSVEADQIREKFKELNAQTKIFSSGEEFDKFQVRCEKARVAIEEYAKKYSAIKSRPDLVRELDDLKKKSQNLNTEGQLDALINSYNKFDLKVQEAGLKTQSFGDKLKKAFANFSSFFTASRLIYEAISAIDQMLGNISKLDTAMVELRKVTDATDQEFAEFLDNATSKAVELGTTITDLVNATSDFSRLGFSLEDSEKLGQIAIVYANVGDEVNSIDEATSSLISTLKGFGLETADASAILDKFNEVGNNFAITSGGIGSALQRSASSMAAANNTIDETIALITAANTVVQDADVVGTAFKTVSMRIRGATTELEAAGLDMDGMAESTADLREEIKALSGVDIMIDDNTFKSTYKIIEELAAKWKDLTDIQQASITELIAGKNFCQNAQKCA